MPIPVSIKVKLRVTKPGVSAHKGRLYKTYVAVVGSGLQLGNLDPNKAPRATFVGGDVWEKDIWVAKHTELEYTWMVVDHYTSQIVETETLPPRKLLIGSHTTLVKDVFNNPRTFISHESDERLEGTNCKRNDNSYRHSGDRQTKEIKRMDSTEAIRRRKLQNAEEISRNHGNESLSRKSSQTSERVEDISTTIVEETGEMIREHFTEKKPMENFKITVFNENGAGRTKGTWRHDTNSEINAKSERNYNVDRDNDNVDRDNDNVDRDNDNYTWRSKVNETDKRAMIGDCKTVERVVEDRAQYQRGSREHVVNGDTPVTRKGDSANVGRASQIRADRPGQFDQSRRGRTIDATVKYLDDRAMKGSHSSKSAFVDHQARQDGDVDKRISQAFCKGDADATRRLDEKASDRSMTRLDGGDRIVFTEDVNNADIIDIYSRTSAKADGPTYAQGPTVFQTAVLAEEKKGEEEEAKQAGGFFKGVTVAGALMVGCGIAGYFFSK